MSFKVPNFCCGVTIRIYPVERHGQSDPVVVRDCDVEHMLISGELFGGREGIPGVAEIEVAGLVLLCQVDVGGAS
jgi:hypothetical protein